VNRGALEQLRRKRKRLSSACFFVAGLGFGTAVYLLRARFSTLSQPGRLSSFLGLVSLMVMVFWLGARAESEVGDLDEQIRDLDERAAAERRRRTP
jgi:hypothetical protein